MASLPTPRGSYIFDQNSNNIPSPMDMDSTRPFRKRQNQENPGPKFFSSGVQILLKRLTRPDFTKVFRKRTNSNIPVLRTPVYKFLTDEELAIEKENANKRADRLLQMPPVVK
ncbi:unnamed protein product, partial [Leptidea sinapis]